MSDSETGISHDESTLIVQLPDDLKTSNRKECLFRSNKVQEGIQLSQFSRGATSFGSDLLKNIELEKQHDESPPVQRPLPALPLNIPTVKKTRSVPPVAGFFTIDRTITTGMGSSSEPGEPTRQGSLSPGPKRKPIFQRKGSLSPGPVSSGHQKMKWESRPSRYQPYSASERLPYNPERKRMSSVPDEVSFDTDKFRSKRQEFKKEQWEIKRFDFPHNSLVSSIFSSHPRHSKVIAALATDFRIKVDKLEQGDHLAVQLEGHPKGIAKATDKLTELIKQVQECIVLEVMSPLVPCAYLPVLVSQQLQNPLKEIEKKNRVNLLVCKTKDNHLPLNSEEFIQPFAFSSPESLPKLVDFKDCITPLQPVHSKYKWKAQDDCGEFQQVSSKIEDFLNQCYYSGLPQFSHDGKHYQVDVVGDMLHETDTGVVRKLLKQPRPPVWSYCMGRGLKFIDFKPHDSETLDNTLHYGGADIKVLNVQKGTVDFENMALVNLGSELAMPLIDLQRNPAISGLPTYGIRLAIKGLKDDIEFAKIELRNRLEQIKFVEKRVSIPMVSLEQRHMIRTQVVNNARQYFVELSVKEDEGNDQVFIVVNGEEKYIHNVYLRLQGDTIELQQHLLSQERQHIDSRQFYISGLPRSGSYPVEWQPQKKPCELQNVTANSVEWNGVLHEMMKTMPNIKLVKLERVQNKALWDKYALESVHMKERNGDAGTNEKLLFHGTSTTDPKVIVESVKGIDFRYSSQDRGLLWGKGAYFAVNASYSDSYSHLSGNDKQMLLVRVLTGRSCRYEHHDRSLTKPPPLSHGSHMLCDTVNGHTNGSQVYVVYDHDRAYPAYLITYR